MDAFGPLQPREWIAILATALDLVLTVYGVWSGLAREAGAAGFLFKGKKAAVAVVVAGVALHFLVRYKLTDVRSWSPGTQATAWGAMACLRGAMACWNFSLLSKAKRGRP